ncbi:flagellar brake protein [Niallia sp. Krafla_26]|uniref:flagellar brake protein n=1 Tax=Niallia sp. Krafla_26 TaxID=3064703 RepID=UPI003D1793E9
MLTIGETLILEPRDNEQSEKYRCRLVEKSENVIFIDYPINLKTNRTTFLVDGTQLKVSFVSGNSAYLFNTEVLGRVLQGIPMIKLSFPGNQYVMKVQRRQFVRISTAVDVAIHSLQNEFPPFTTVTEDISAGGSLLFLNQDNINMKPGMIVMALFVLPMQDGEYHYLKLKSKVIRKLKHEEMGKTLFSLQFMNVSAIDRQTLLRFTFDRELALKKKELIE